MIKLQIKQLLRSKSLGIGLVLLFFLGLISLQIGKSFNERQQFIIEQTALAQKEHINRHLKYVDGHIGLLLYYIRFGLANESPAIAGLSIGQRDTRQAAQLINIRNLEEQKNTSELVNPFYQLLGNMDFSFVLIYLFPLIIIVLSFNLLSEEKESGRWSLLCVQSNNPSRVIKAKLLIRLVCVMLLLIVLLLLGSLYLNISFNQNLMAFCAHAILYVLFWFVLVWWATSLGKSSNQNALILLSFWLLLTTIIPSIVNNVVNYKYPIAAAYETTIDSRDGYHNKWDEPKEPTLLKFKEHYPQFAKYQHPEAASFSWLWYYAMQQMGDDESAVARQTMKQKIENRSKLTKWIGYFVPSIHTQLSMNFICKTGLHNYLNYMEALETYHEDLRLSFYPKIFEEEPIQNQKWETYNLQYFKEGRPTNWISLLPVIILSFVFLLSAKQNGHQNSKEKK